MATQSSPSLYDRLGGVYSIATVMDDFIDRIMVDPRLNANPKVDEAHHRVTAGRVQVPRHRDGLLAYWRTPKIHRPLHERLPSALEDYGSRMGGIPRRSNLLKQMCPRETQAPAHALWRKF